MSVSWHDGGRIEAHEWRCSYLTAKTPPTTAVLVPRTNTPLAAAASSVVLRGRIPRCGLPTLLAPRGVQIPEGRFGEPVAHLPTDVGELYNQARSCMAVSGYTGAVLVGRKLLMHIAVTQGADENRRSRTTWTTSPRTAS